MGRVMEQMLLPYGGIAGFKEITTSRAAAYAMTNKAPTLRDKVLQAIKDAGAKGLTPDECALAIGKTSFTTRPRLTELGPKGLGLIERVERRANESGLDAWAWRVKL